MASTNDRHRIGTELHDLLKTDNAAKVERSVRVLPPGAPGTRNARNDTRHYNPVFQVAVLGEAARTVNWSLGGLLVAGFKGIVTARDIIPLVLCAPDDAGNFMPAAARVVWYNRHTGVMALKFEQLSAASRTWLITRQPRQSKTGTG